MGMELKVEYKPARTQLLFEAIYRIYLDNGSLDTEYIWHDSLFFATIGFSGDLSEEVNEALDEFFKDPLEFIDTMLAYDPKFRIDLKNEEDIYIHIVGEFEEETFTEGSWEEGYFTCLRFIPVVRGYEVVSEKSVSEFLKFEEERYD